jgi:iron-sulfur cluster assembly protein
VTIKITESAAQQIAVAAKQGEMPGLALRIAARRRTDVGVTVVVAPTSTELVDGMTLDFVEMKPGRSDFIFLNPNDPHFVPPESSAD